MDKSRKGKKMIVSRGFVGLCDFVDFLRYPIDGSLAVMGKRWAAPVLMEILNGHDRFNSLLAAVPGLNPRTLSARLDDFEKLGLVRREEVRSSPLRVHYRLTKKGEDMRSLLREATNFSLRWYNQRFQAE